MGKEKRIDIKFQLVNYHLQSSHTLTIMSPGDEIGRHARLKTCLPAGRSGVRKDVRINTNYCSGYMFMFLYSNRSKQKYIGMTNDIERRIHEHNSGQNKSTKGFGPYILIYYESCVDGIEGRKREKYLKSGIGREFLKEYVTKN